MNSALNLPSPSPAMNPFIQPDYIGAVHARLGLLLTSRQHILLRAQEPVFPEPGDPPLPGKPAKVPKPPKPQKIRAVPNMKHKANRAQVLAALTDKQQSYKDIARETGLRGFCVQSALSNLVFDKLAVNHSKNGKPGMYTLPVVAPVTQARGVFDV